MNAKDIQSAIIQKSSNDMLVWKDILNSFGIGYVENPYDSDKGEQILQLQSKISERVSGYTGFMADLVFNEEGKFKRVDIFE